MLSLYVPRSPEYCPVNWTRRPTSLFWKDSFTGTLKDSDTGRCEVNNTVCVLFNSHTHKNTNTHTHRCRCRDKCIFRVISVSVSISVCIYVGPKTSYSSSMDPFVLPFLIRTVDLPTSVSETTATVMSRKYLDYVTSLLSLHLSLPWPLHPSRQPMLPTTYWLLNRRMWVTPSTLDVRKRYDQLLSKKKFVHM